jgi:type I restriction-modification system DNA methylase subunit
LDPLEIPKSLKSGNLLQSNLQGFFNLVLKIDYETIYSTDFIDQIAFPENQDVVDEIKELIEVLGKYDFSLMGYDVIGRIFEKLIPEEERHILGQYFTSPDVVDFILRFCLIHETDKILDPACGAGTFLVRSYQHKKLMNQRLTHEEILRTLWGNDIAKFPAHLTTINLAINDLRSDENYPRVIRKDFFDLLPDRVEFALPESWRKVQIKGLGNIEKTLEHPRFFDAIVGNPPYTRHLEIEDIQEKSEGYKDKLIQKALIDPEGRKFADISKRAGIYAYFFIHGTKFLQNGGKLGFIVSNSWLDADYGKGLQEHFLTYYKIIAIIESKVERWFEDAEVNTCIVILEKAGGDKLKRERNEHRVRFAYLKRSLRQFIPPAENMWEKEVGRLDAIGRLIKTILAHSSYYENDDLRVYPKRWR